MIRLPQWFRRRSEKIDLRSEGRAVEALLILLKHLTAHARWVFAVLLALYAASGVRVIPPQQQALVLRFGRLEPKVHGPGLLVGLPEPFDRVLRFETATDRTVTLDAWSRAGEKIGDPHQPIALSEAELSAAIRDGANGGAAEARYPDTSGTTLDPVINGYSITADINIIQGRFAVRYRIDDPFHYASAGTAVDTLIANLGYRALAAQLAVRPIDASLTSERRAIAAGAAADLQNAATRLNLGIRVSGLDIRELSPPSQVLAAFEDVVNARQFQKTLYENSRQYAAESQAKSEGEAAAIRHRAEAFASDLTAQAAGEAAAFSSLLAHYERTPTLVAGRLLAESLDLAMRRIGTRTLVPTGQSQPALLIEPLPEFVQ